MLIFTRKRVLEPAVFCVHLPCARCMYMLLLGFPSDVAAAASPVGSNVSCRKGIERIVTVVGRNSAHRRLGQPLGIEHEDELRANVLCGCDIPFSVFWQHCMDDKYFQCRMCWLNFSGSLRNQQTVAPARNLRAQQNSCI